MPNHGTKYRSNRRRHKGRYRASRMTIGGLLAENRGMLIGCALFAFSALAAGAAAVSASTLRHDRAYDEATLCLLNKPPSQFDSVLVDRTDPLTKDNEPKFQSMMVGLGEAAPRGTRLMVVPFSDKLGDPLAKTFDVCAPGRRKDADALTESGTILESAYSDKFAGPLKDAIRDLTEAASAPESPIAEQIERFARDRMLTPTEGPRKIYLVTDLLQNTATVSAYDHSRPFALPQPRDKFLSGFTVQIVQLPNIRDARHQTAELMNEWVRWLKAAGAKIEDPFLPSGEWKG